MVLLIAGSVSAKDFRAFPIKGDYDLDGQIELAYILSSGRADLSIESVPKFLVIEKNHKVIFREPLGYSAPNGQKNYFAFKNGYIQVSEAFPSKISQEQREDLGLGCNIMIGKYPVVIVCFTEGTGNRVGYQYNPRTKHYRFVLGGD